MSQINYSVCIHGDEGTVWFTDVFMTDVYVNMYL